MRLIKDYYPKVEEPVFKILYNTVTIVKIISVCSPFRLMQVLLNEMEASKVQDLAKIHAI